MSLKPVPSEPNRQAGITLRYKEMASEPLTGAMQKLDEFTGWRDSKDIHRFNKLKQIFDREQKKAGVWYRKLVEKHAVMEDVMKKSAITGQMEQVTDPKTGKPQQKPKWAPNDSGKMDIVFRDFAAFEKDMAVFHAHEIPVKVFQFDAEDFIKAGLTPLELRACSRMIDKIDPELLKDEPSEDQLASEVPEGLEALFPEEASGQHHDGSPD